LTGIPKRFRVISSFFGGVAMSDELNIVLEDVKEKFDTVIGAFNMVKERLDRHEKAEEERFERLETEVLSIKADVAEIRHDLKEHRNNTELHAKKAS
jgi:hypothetical protein